MKTKEINTDNPYNQALVDCLRIINSYSRSGNNKFEWGLIDDSKIDPIRKKIKELVK